MFPAPGIWLLDAGVCGVNCEAVGAWCEEGMPGRLYGKCVCNGMENSGWDEFLRSVLSLDAVLKLNSARVIPPGLVRGIVYIPKMDECDSCNDGPAAPSRVGDVRELGDEGRRSKSVGGIAACLAARAVAADNLRCSYGSVTGAFNFLRLL